MKIGKDLLLRPGFNRNTTVQQVISTIEEVVVLRWYRKKRKPIFGCETIERPVFDPTILTKNT